MGLRLGGAPSLSCQDREERLTARMMLVFYDGFCILKYQSSYIFFMCSLQGPRGLPGASIKKNSRIKRMKSDRVFQVSVVSRTGSSGIVIDGILVDFFLTDVFRTGSFQVESIDKHPVTQFV